MILPPFTYLTAAAHFAVSASNAKATDTGVLAPGWSAAGAAGVAAVPPAQGDRRLAGTCTEGTVTCVNGYVEGTGESCATSCGEACCVGVDACHEFTGQLCKDGASCMGFTACYKANIGSVVGGCNNYDSCNQANMDSVVEGCNGDSACFKANIPSVVEGCKGDYSCLKADISPGVFGCCNTAYSACYYSDSLPASCPATAPTDIPDPSTDSPSMAPSAAGTCTEGTVTCVNGFVEGTGSGYYEGEKCEDACDGACCVGHRACEDFTGQLCKDGASCMGSYACSVPDPSTDALSTAPSAAGTDLPTEIPSAEGTDLPTETPSAAGTDFPTESPSAAEGTDLPTEIPSAAEGTDLPTETPSAAGTEAPFAVVDCCVGVDKCRQNAHKCKCMNNKCKKKKKDCMTKGDEMQWWGCADGKTCVAGDNNKGQPKMWGKCRSA